MFRSLTSRMVMSCVPRCRMPLFAIIIGERLCRKERSAVGSASFARLPSIVRRSTVAPDSEHHDCPAFERRRRLARYFPPPRRAACRLVHDIFCRDSLRDAGSQRDHARLGPARVNARLAIMDFPKAAVIGLIGDADDVPHDYMLDGLGLRIDCECRPRSKRNAGLEPLSLVRSAEPTLLRSVADEVWWFQNGAVRLKGDPDEVLARIIARRCKTTEGFPDIPCALRRGDGRARLIVIETLNAADQLVSAWQSGEAARIRVRVRFESPVDDPVIGIMIRTRIGIEVYGTNTELEKLKLGPCDAGEIRAVTFEFPLRSLSAVLYNYSGVARPGWRLA